METQTAAELLDAFTKRVSNLSDLLRRPCIANRKERRQNPTWMFPLPAYIRRILPPFISQPTEPDGDPQFVDDLWNTILEPFCAAASRGPQFPIPFKVSVKTAAPGFGPHGDRLLHAMRVSRTPPERFVRFSELYAVLGGTSQYELATRGSIGSSQFFADALSVLGSPLDNTEIREAFDRKYRQSAPSARLKTKVILQRCELRSFCYDEDIASAVVGGMLHSIIHPQNKTHRSALGYSTVWTVRGKNILQNEVKIRKGQTIMEMKGDVSSFSSSERNIWTATITAAAHLEHSTTEGEPCILLLLYRGQPILVNFAHLLRLYVFLNFRRLIYDELEGDVYASEGGPLGVAAINTLANIVFSALQVALSRSVARYPTPTSYSAQNGGDDFHSISISRSEFSLEEVMLLVKATVIKYIGEFSEFDVRLIRPHVSPHSDFMSLSLFCKKAVRVRVCTGKGGELTVRWQSQFSLPLYSVFLEDAAFRSKPDFDKKARAFAGSLETSIPWVPEKKLLIDTFLHIFAMLHGPLDREIVLQPTQVVVPVNVELSELGFTKAAELLVLSEDFPKGPDGAVLYKGWDAQVLVLVRQGRLRKLWCLQADSWVSVTCLPAEMKYFERTERVVYKPELDAVPLGPLIRLCIALIDCRRECANYCF